jgi:RNA polymerase sigma factor (sigma-70 family)
MAIPAEPPAAEPEPLEPASPEPASPEPESAEPLPPSDADLIAASRSGDAAAYATLYQRHVAAANSLARQLVRGPAEADDVVAESFAKVLDLLRRGGGPEGGFRPYLLTAVRRAAYDRHRAERRQLVTDEMEAFDPGVPFADPAVADLERTMIARAFSTLPERWQAVLWHTEIEGARPAEVASLLGLTANGVAALAYRAREGLRQAYLQMHLSDAARDECRPVAAKLGAYVRGGLAKRDAATVAAHLDQCPDCQQVLAELGDVNVALRSIVAPLILGPAAAAYLAAASRSAGGGIAGQLARFRHAPKRQQAAAAGVAVAAVAGLVALAMTLTANTGPAAGGAPAHRPLPPAAGAAPAGPVAPAASRSPAREPSPVRPQPRTSSEQPHRQPLPGPASATPGPATPGPATPVPATPGTPAPSVTPPATSVPAATPVPATPQSSAPVPSAVPSQYAKLTIQINAVGTLPQGATGIVTFMVTNTSSVIAAQVNAVVTLPPGVSYLAAGALGMDSMDAAGPGGWTCTPATGGATCTHGPLAAVASATGYLPVAVAADAPTGTPPAISVRDGGPQVSARGTTGVAASGFPARFAASGQYAVVIAGAPLTGASQASRTGTTLALRGQVVWAGLYWAWAGGQPRAAIALRGPAGNYQQVTGAVPAVAEVGIPGLADTPVYQAFADVTSQVARYGAGVWQATAAPVTAPAAGGWYQAATGGGQAATGGDQAAARGDQAAGGGYDGTGAKYLGWTLVVVTADPGAPSGQVMVLDGARQVDAADPYFSASLGGLPVRDSAGAANVQVVAWTYDGPEPAAFTRPRTGGSTVSFAAGDVPYLVGVIAATDSQQPNSP